MGYMKVFPIRQSSTFFISLVLFSQSLFGFDDYTNGPDSYPQPGISAGTITEHVWSNSQVYPGIFRKYWIYVPPKADPKKPLALMIFQDGEGFVKSNGTFRAAVVMDNLIARGEMPPAAGLFVNPGRKIPVDETKRPENRGNEYDSLTNLYARLLIEELIPEVEKKVTLSTNPETRCLVGSSSGAIAAFTACWERPYAFRKVISFIGSYVDLRGGHVYPSLVRKTRPVKPIRIFLQDGSNDIDNAYGNWPLANQQMAAAFKFSGYDYQFVMGDGGHTGKHGASILPEALRWIWRDWKDIAW